jgi:hypothetical protein
MATGKPVPKKKYFTAEQANAALPLVRAIVQDVVQLARDLRERQDRLSRVPPRDQLGEAYREEVQQAHDEFERDRERLLEYEQELRSLGVELKDYYTGLVDFPCWMDGREVYLCWRLGEPEIGFWHELDAGFAGRQKLKARTSKA